MIRVAQASSSETYTKYGKSPNQRRTGVTKTRPEGNLDGELNVIEFKGGWEAVYRPLDPTIAERIATFMLQAVSNGNYIGYSWSGNTELFDALKKKGSTNPLDVDTLVNTDCATLVGAAVYYAGIHADGLRAMTTARMDSVIMGTNAFSKLTNKELCQQGKGIRRGDLLWRSGHCACALDTDPVAYGVSLTNEALKFTNASGAVTGNYPNNVNMSKLFYFQSYSFNKMEITSGTPGTRAAQFSRAISKQGYRPVVARLASVSNSALANVTPFLGGGGENKLYVNCYRASGAAGTVDATVVIVYVRTEVTGVSW